MSDFAEAPDRIVEAVVDDLWRRSDKGRQKYGAPVGEQPHELKVWMQHAYEEALDLAIYLKRAMRELP